MLELLKKLFRKPPPAPSPEARPLTPEYVDRLIETAGRDAVFALARANGWGPGSNPPIWVWAGLAREVILAHQAPTADELRRSLIEGTETGMRDYDQYRDHLAGKTTVH